MDTCSLISEMHNTLCISANINFIYFKPENRAILKITDSLTEIISHFLTIEIAIVILDMNK